MTRGRLLNGEFGAFERDYSKIGEGFSTPLKDVLIWTGVTNYPGAKTTKLVMRRIPAGVGYYHHVMDWGKPIRTITVSQPYYIGVFELTQKQYSYFGTHLSFGDYYNPHSVAGNIGDNKPLQNFGVLKVLYQDIRVWDAFSGSGAFGLECVSRYPNAVVSFTDIAPTSIKTIRDNLKNLGVDSRASVIQSDAIAEIGRLGANADVVFVDAPYDNADLGRAFVKKLGAVAKTGAILIWEQESTNFVPIDENLWDVLRDKTYGRARFLILEKK